MHRIITVFSGVLVTAIALFLSAAAAEAAALVTWVSGTGNDADNCTSPATPCRQFTGATGALAKTDAGGIIHVLPGDYDGFRIDKTIEIIADAGQASITGNYPILGSFTAGISVETASTDIVRLRGLTVVVPLGLSGVGGIMLQSAGVLHVEDSTFVTSLNRFGILFAPTGVGELHVSSSTLSDNGNASAGGGILIKPSGAGSAKVVLENVLIDNNRVGILIDGAASTGGIDMSVSDSTISGGTGQGLSVFEAVSGAPSKVQVARTTISSNGGQGIFASRSLATVRVRQSEITGNTVGVQTQNGGQIISHGDNVLADNTTNGAFTTTLPPQ